MSDSPKESGEEKKAVPSGKAEDAGESPAEKKTGLKFALARGKRVAQESFSERSRSWVYEIPIFYLGLVLLQRALLPDDPGFAEVNPNPFWLGVLLFAGRYGIAAGLASGLVSSLLYALGFYMAGGSYRFADLDFYLQPGLFVVLGAAIGFTADRFMHRISTLQKRIDDLDELTLGLKRQIQSEQKVLRSVEQQVVSQMTSVVTLFQGSKELGTLDRSELFPAMLDFFTDAIRAKKSSIYLPANGKWELLENRNWEAGDEYPKSFSVPDGVMGLALAEKHVMSLRDLMLSKSVDAESFGRTSDAILAVPVLDPHGEPVALFAVQAMDFLRFNSAAVNLAVLLGEWGAESVAKCVQVEGLRSRSILDEDYLVNSVSYFEERVSQEFDRSLRFALPFSVILIRPEKIEEIPVEKRMAYLRVICRVVRETVRKIDVVCRTAYEFAPFAVLLMTTTRENAAHAERRLLEALAKVDLGDCVSFGTGSYNAEMKKKEEIIEEARATLG